MPGNTTMLRYLLNVKKKLWDRKKFVLICSVKNHPKILERVTILQLRQYYFLNTNYENSSERYFLMNLHVLVCYV